MVKRCTKQGATIEIAWDDAGRAPTSFRGVDTMLVADGFLQLEHIDRRDGVKLFAASSVNAVFWREEGEPDD